MAPLTKLWLFAKEWLLPARRLISIEGDLIPDGFSKRNLALLKEGGEDWCVAFRCPCGCGRLIELPLIPEAKPNWRLSCNKNGRPSLHPSVWLKEGCRSHFFIKEGKVIWV